MGCTRDLHVLTHAFPTRRPPYLSMTDQTVMFERHRPRLRGLAYRMLGARDEAEDAVQEAFLRWHRADAAEIRSPEAWLVTVVTRLCLDRLRAEIGRAHV